VRRGALENPTTGLAQKVQSEGKGSRDYLSGQEGWLAPALNWLRFLEQKERAEVSHPS